VTEQSAAALAVVRPSDIDSSFVPVPLPSLVGAEVEGSAVLINERSGRMHLLDQIGTVCWERIDGEADVAGIAADLATAFGADPAVVSADVVRLVRLLGEEGMLANAAEKPLQHGHQPEGEDELESGHEHHHEHDHETHRAPRDIEIEMGPRFLEERMSPCLEKLNRLDWPVTSTYLIGGVHLGVRTTIPAVDAVLRRALAAHLVDGIEAPPNYSLLIDPDGKGYDFVYRSTAAVVRTRDPRRIASGLVSHLSTHVQEPPAQLLHIKGTVLVHEGRAILAPAQTRGWIEQIGRRLGEAGLVMVDLPSAWVDPVTAEVVVPPYAIEVDWDALGALADVVPQGRPRRPDPGVAPGRYPLVGWAFYAALDHVGPVAAPTAALFGAPQVMDVQANPHRAVRGVAGLVPGLDTVGIFWDNPAEMVDPLARLAGARS
jgi:hypothetical protein